MLPNEHKHVPMVTILMYADWSCHQHWIRLAKQNILLATWSSTSCSIQPPVLPPPCESMPVLKGCGRLFQWKLLCPAQTTVIPAVGPNTKQDWLVERNTSTLGHYFSECEGSPCLT